MGNTVFLTFRQLKSPAEHCPPKTVQAPGKRLLMMCRRKLLSIRLVKSLCMLTASTAVPFLPPMVKRWERSKTERRMMYTISMMIQSIHGTGSAKTDGSHPKETGVPLYRKNNRLYDNKKDLENLRVHICFQLQISQLNAAPPIAATSVNGTPIRMKSFVDTS